MRQTDLVLGCLEFCLQHGNLRQVLAPFAGRRVQGSNDGVVSALPGLRQRLLDGSLTRRPLGEQVSQTTNDGLRVLRISTGCPIMQFLQRRRNIMQAVVIPLIWGMAAM